MFRDALAGSVLSRAVRGKKFLAEMNYAAPETLDGVTAADELSDLYSLGVVLYTLVTGRAPYLGSSARELLVQMASRPPKPRKYAKALPKRFEWVILTLLEKERHYRFQSASELLVYLNRIASEHGVAV